MAESLVFLTEPDAARRATVLAVLRRVPGTRVQVFDTLAATRKAMRATLPRLMIGPWSEGGETLLAARAALAGSAGHRAVPQALVLAETVTPSRISLTREAGLAELIPASPLDAEGLFNRLTLLLRGPEALYAVLDAPASWPLDAALENMPALRKRLVA